jgi:protein O-GlcNAc transferase
VAAVVQAGMSGLLDEAVAHHQAGRLAEAERCYKAARTVAPGVAIIPGLLGDVLQALGRSSEAEAAYRDALRLDPTLAVVHMNLGLLLRAQRRLDDAVPELQLAVQHGPRLPEARLNLGLALYEAGRLHEALGAYQRCLALRPNYPEAYLNLGSLLHAQNRYDEARAAYESALKLRPDYGEAHYSLGVTLFDEGRLDDAAAAYHRCLAALPRHEGGRNNLALIYQVMGRHADAAALYRRGMAEGPNPATAARYLFLNSLYDPDADLDARFAEQRQVEDRFARPLYAHRFAVGNSPDPSRRLRVGYVSSDFRDHPIGRNVEPLLVHRNRAHFELFLYADVARPDDSTARLRVLADHWRAIAGWTDEEVAAQIHRDQIDVLVVLAGHFDKNRPLVFAYRPAPVQISFHDLLTTGLETVDYFIGDRTVCATQPRESFTERVVRLPSLYVHAALPELPISPPPSATRGEITFGSFNNPAKVNDRVLRMWAEILRAVPRSRLVLKFRNWFQAPTIQERIRRVAEAHGVDAARLHLEGAPDDVASHLLRYDAIDVALDTFPFSGSTTTFEALWMGVPVVTMMGPTVASRWTASMLRALRLDELVTETPQAYVDTAVRLAGDAAKLAELRATLRDRIRPSPLLDGGLRARQVERVYRAVWRRWCARAGAGGAAA